MQDTSPEEPKADAYVNADRTQSVLTASPVSTVRAGWKTTEFWLSLALVILDFLLALQGVIPADHAVAYATLTGALYKGLRAFLKVRAGRLDLDAYLAELASTTLAGPDANSQARGMTGGAASESGHALAAPVLMFVAMFWAALALIACFSGCANSAVDQDFRRKVQAVDVTSGVTYDTEHKTGTGTFGTRIEFRDPDAKRVQIPRTGSLVPQLDILFHAGRVIVPGVGNFPEYPQREGAGGNAGRSSRVDHDDNGVVSPAMATPEASAGNHGLVVTSNFCESAPSAGPAFLTAQTEAWPRIELCTENGR